MNTIFVVEVYIKFIDKMFIQSFFLFIAVAVVDVCLFQTYKYIFFAI